jgi:hypothetical protein
MSSRTRGWRPLPWTILTNRPLWGYYCHDLVVAWLIKIWFLDWTLDLLDTPHTILNYNLQWRSCQFSVTPHITLSLFHYYGSIYPAIGPPGLLSHTRALVPPSNGGRSPSWVPKLSTFHSHSDPQCTVHLLPPLSPIVLSGAFSSNWHLLGVEVKLRPTVSRPVYLGAGLPSGTHDQIFRLYRQLRFSWCVAPSLTRVCICN